MEWDTLFNGITAISTVVMAIATIVMAVAAWQAKQSFISSKKCDILFDMYDELVNAKDCVWEYLSSRGEKDGTFLVNIKPILKNINVLKDKISPFISDETKEEIQKLEFNYGQLQIYVAQGADKKSQLEVINKIIKNDTLDTACNAIAKEIKR